LEYKIQGFYCITIQYDNIITEHLKLDILPPLPPTWASSPLLFGDIEMFGKAQKKVLKCQQASREKPTKKNDRTGNSRRGGKIKT
jgi:hypothetical protein